MALRLERDLCKKALKTPALRKKGPKTSEWFFEVNLVTDAEIKKINHEFLGKNYATDVLSFPASAEFRKLGHLGELIIAAGVLKRQAREQKHPSTHELRILMAHGFLHLLGFDHEKGPRAFKEMLKREQKLLGTKQSGLIGRSLPTKRTG